uniref:Uncharacterized protein n=1 Tax=Oryza glumipatula TaxID=40148 RepID=A0A0E0BL51_9ORYZ
MDQKKQTTKQITQEEGQAGGLRCSSPNLHTPRCWEPPTGCCAGDLPRHQGAADHPLRRHAVIAPGGIRRTAVVPGIHRLTIAPGRSRERDGGTRSELPHRHGAVDPPDLLRSGCRRHLDEEKRGCRCGNGERRWGGEREGEQRCWWEEGAALLVGEREPPVGRGEGRGGGWGKGGPWWRERKGIYWSRRKFGQPIGWTSMSRPRGAG